MKNIKYVGSKQRLSKDIVPIIQQCIDENKIEKYLEPFVGGANLIDKIKCKNKTGLDFNKYLIALLKFTQSGNLKKENPYFDKEKYDNIKDNKSKYKNWEVGYAGFCCTYNAKFFGGYAKITTTKIGTIRDYQDESKRNLIKQSEDLKEISFAHKDFFELNDDFSNYFVYCDSPYKNTTDYNIGEFNHNAYWDKIRQLSENNYIMCSEYNAPNDFVCIKQFALNNTLDKNSRSNPIEKLFVYKNGLFANYLKSKESDAFAK